MKSSSLLQKDVVPGADIYRPSKVHLPALDGLRAVAIVGVLLSHTLLVFAGYGTTGKALESVAHAGAFGVDLFFVISGFLITGILLDTPTSAGYFRNFYARRCLRLFPIFYGYLLVVMLVVPLLHRATHTSMNDYSGNWLWYLTYFCNWKANFAAGDPYLGHFWSLALEEQFYLLWPAIIFLTSRRQLVWVCVALIVYASILRTGWSIQNVYWNQIYRLTVTRSDTMAFGALAAIAIRSDAWRSRAREIGPWLASAGLTAWIWVAVSERSFSWQIPAIQTYGATLAALGFTGLVLLTATRPANPICRWLKSPMLISIGKYSYAMYVFHLLIFEHVVAACDLVVKKTGLSAMPFQIAAFVATNLLVYWIATLSWRFVEAPILKLKDRFVTLPSAQPSTQASASPAGAWQLQSPGA